MPTTTIPTTLPPLAEAMTARVPTITLIPIGTDRLAVRVYHDGSVTLELTSARASFVLDIPRAATGDLIHALAPETSVLIETLDMLASAADLLVPSLMVHGQLSGEERECRDRIADARAVLGVHASC